jgi:hypothetical protein
MERIVRSLFKLTLRWTHIETIACGLSENSFKLEAHGEHNVPNLSYIKLKELANPQNT